MRLRGAGNLVPEQQTLLLIALPQTDIVYQALKPTNYVPTFRQAPLGSLSILLGSFRTEGHYVDFMST